MEGEGGTLLSYLLSMQVRSSTRKPEPNRNDAHERKDFERGQLSDSPSFSLRQRKKKNRKSDVAYTFVTSFWQLANEVNKFLPLRRTTKDERPNYTPVSFLFLDPLGVSFPFCFIHSNSIPGKGTKWLAVIFTTPTVQQHCLSTSSKLKTPKRSGKMKRPAILKIAS